MEEQTQTPPVDLSSFSVEDLMKFLPSDMGTRKLGEKVGRNDTCPCGSGKKFKKCCLNTNLDNRGNEIPKTPWVMAEEAPAVEEAPVLSQDTDTDAKEA